MPAELVETLHMVPGDGDTSYARNSTVQSGHQSNLKPMIEEAVASLLNDPYPGGMAIADLGCSSGPNTLVLVSTAVDAIRRRCLELRQKPPELCIHLNDLPSNDFSSVIRSLATYTKAQESFSPVLTSIVPGSFHGRLFNKCSLHLVCSTSSLHWLSKAPEDLVQNGIPFYDRDEAVRRSARRSTVIKAYARQFNDDLTRILHLRAQEMVPGGRMVFSLVGQRSDDKPEKAIQYLEFINAILHEMAASKGLIDEEKLGSFYIPIYGPSEKELREIIEAEGSFSIDKIAVLEPPQTQITAKTTARVLRAALEPIIVHHFGLSTDAMDEFLRTAEKLIKMAPDPAEYPSKPCAYIAASLMRRRT